MDLYENHTHSFVVKVWLENAMDEVGHPRWRGYITHIPDNERQYFQHLEDVPPFIARYLERMGVKLEPSNPLRRWLKHLSP
ncbi:MAG: hypothetical protein HY326_00980 [Chloroflexi bacterium]|nr:hypothetical protein [Chloroflexota bacterium]